MFYVQDKIGHMTQKLKNTEKHPRLMVLVIKSHRLCDHM